MRWVYHLSPLTCRCTWARLHSGPFRCTYCHSSFKTSSTPRLVALFCFLEPKWSYTPLLEDFLFFNASSTLPAFRYFLGLSHPEIISLSFVLQEPFLYTFFVTFFLTLNVNMLIVDYLEMEKNINREVRIMCKPPSSSVNIWHKSFQSF